MMNFFLPNFFNYIQTIPSNIVHQFDENVFANDTTSISTCLLTLMVIMTAMEVLILILCNLYDWLPLPQTFWWLENGAGECEQEEETERASRIRESLTETLWTEIHGGCCSVYLTNFQTNDVVVSGSTNCCHYVFHKKCLYRWLKVQSICPCCRHQLLQEAPKIHRETTRPTVSMLTEDVSMSISPSPWTTDAPPQFPFDAWDFCFFLF